MTTRKRLEGALAEWHPHPKDHSRIENNSLVPVVREAGATDEIADRFFDSAPELPTPEPPVAIEPEPRRVAIDSAAVRARRRYLMRYVAGAVSLASVIGLAAIVRMTIARDASAADTPLHAIAAVAIPQVAARRRSAGRGRRGSADRCRSTDRPERARGRRGSARCGSAARRSRGSRRPARPCSKRECPGQREIRGRRQEGRAARP